MSAIKLTKNFELNEFIYSVTAEANKIDNRPSVPVINNLKLLCKNVLQPLRDYLGTPIKITSGYRCLALNRKLGSKDNSQHIKGCAADFICSDLNKAFDYIKDKLPFDQLLYEYDKQGNRWIHISYVGDGNRKYFDDNYAA